MPSFGSLTLLLGASTLFHTLANAAPPEIFPRSEEQRAASTLFVERDVGLEAINTSAYPSLLTLTIDEAIDGFASGRFTSENLVTAYMRRIAQVNGQLHAVTEVNPDALEIAKALDAERKAGTIRGVSSCWARVPLVSLCCEYSHRR